MPEQILGTYDLEKKVEDTVILLELTTVNYGDPNRAVLIEEAIEELLNAKMRIGSAHRFALVGFGEDAETLLQFEDWTGPESLMQVLYEKVKLMGDEANFTKALKKAFDTAVKSMQKLAEGKLFRILIISEGRFIDLDDEWADLADIASKIGLYIDAVKLGLNNDPTLKRVTRMTSGDYVECDVSELKSWLPSFAAVKKQTNINQSEADKNLKGLLELVAAPLITVRDQVKEPKDLVKLMDEKDASMKCGICYSSYCMICKGPPYACGAYCPNCGRFFHVHCAAAWAENSKDTPNNVFKCPVCFSLLKVPGELYRVKVLKGRLKDSFLPPKERAETETLKASELGEGWELETCVVCHCIFENPDDKVIRCTKCGALYHPECMDKNEETHKGRCRVCDSPIRRRFDTSRGIMRVV